MKKQCIVGLLFLTVIYQSRAQYFKYFTSNQSIKLLNPAYVASDSGIDVSFNSIYSYYSYTNFGQTALFVRNNGQTNLVAQRSAYNSKIDQGLISKTYEFKNGVSAGLMLSYENERTDYFLDRNIIGLSSAFGVPIKTGDLSFGYGLQVIFDRSQDLSIKDYNNGSEYKFYAVNRNSFQHSFGANFKSKDQRINFGIAVNNIFQSLYSSEPKSTSVAPFNPQDFTYASIDNKRTLIANLGFINKFSEKIKCQTDIRFGKISNDIKESHQKLISQFQIQFVVKSKYVGSGVTFGKLYLKQEFVGGIIQGYFKNFQLQYAYRLAPTKILSVSSGTHEFGIRYKL